MTYTCIQCRLPAVILLTRPRPYPARGEYQICVPCAVRVREEQDERAQRAIALAERSGA
jgi:hypothetical protein